MSRVKSDVKPKPRSMLNTTINTKVLNDFKGYCKEQGLPMNILLELFMKQIIAGKLALKFGRVEVDKEEDE